MRLIINSYLKTFVKHWVSILGILLFIIMLGAIVLGMMSTPLQLNSQILRVKAQSELYNYKVEDTGKYSQDFDYHYFLLNGHKYTDGENDKNKKILSPVEGYQPIAPKDFTAFLQSIKDNTQPSFQTMFSDSTYLLIDQMMIDAMDGDISDMSWTDLLAAYDAHELNNSLEIDSAMNALNELKNLINSLVLAAQVSASQNLKLDLMSKAPTERDRYVDVFVDDLQTNIENDSWINELQNVRGLYIFNQFRKANDLANVSQINYDELKNELKTPSQQNLAQIGIAFFSNNFRQILWANYRNNVSNFLFAQLFNNPDNPDVLYDGHQNYLLDSSIEFGLSRILPGSWTPEFSTDVRSIEATSSFNKPLLQSGEIPKWDPNNNVHEIVINDSFLKENGLKLGDSLKLPMATFATHVDKNDVVSFDLAKEKNMKIVGTALKYDELTPGENFTSFIQSFKSYTYSYLPPAYLETYIRASFIYSEVSESKDGNVALRIKNIKGNRNPAFAMAINSDTGETIYGDPSKAIIPFGKIPSISKLGSIKIQIIIYTILGLVSLVLAFVFINFVIKKEINETRRQLGIFKSFGYTTAELSLIFAVKTLITISIGMILGWLLSFPLQVYMASNFMNSVMFTYQKIYFNWVLILVIFLAIPALFMLVSYLITLRYLREPALVLINNMASKTLKKPHIGPISKALKRHNKGFEYRLSQSFVKSSKGKFVVVQILFAFSALIYTLMFGAQAIMYQAIEQGFSLIKENTDHEYSWRNKNSLTINESSGGKFTLKDIDNYEDNKINYIDYNGYDNPGKAMTSDSNLKTNFTDARFRFRILTDALSQSITNPEIIPGSEPIDNWVLMPKSVAIQLIKNETPSFNDILNPNNPYFFYRLLTFKALNSELDPEFNNIVSQMINNNQGYQGNFTSLLNDFGTDQKAWISISDITDIAKALQTTFLGMIPQADTKTNNFFLTDLSRIFSMLFANQYILEQLKIKVPDPSVSDEVIIQALNTIYKDAYTNKSSPLYGYDPRDPLYWSLTNNPLFSNLTKQTQAIGDSNIIEVINSLDPSLMGVLTAGMLSSKAPTLLDEAVVNFNNLFFDKNKEHLQLLLDLIPKSFDMGSTSLDLIDFKNKKFGNAQNQYNFEGVTEAQYSQLATKPSGKNTFNGIIPYAVAKKMDVEIGDTIEFYTNTSMRTTIKVVVVGINKSITIPISLSWLIMVDYDTFAQEMFSDSLRDAIHFEDAGLISPYLFNSIISQELMLSGEFNLMSISKSLDSFKFGGNQLVMNVDPSDNVFGPLMMQFASSLNLNGINLEDYIKIDGKMNLITNPMMVNSATGDLVAFPYNIARNGFANFSKTMSDLMAVFLILQSILLTIILCVVMNIIVDEASITILTLRSLGYSQKEINWIIMGPYVVGIIISFIIAYTLSNIIWKVFLVIASKQWDIIIFFPFDWKGLVIPILVLGIIMFFGWLASNYQVNRRPLTQITNLV